MLSTLYKLQGIHILSQVSCLESGRAEISNEEMHPHNEHKAMASERHKQWLYLQESSNKFRATTKTIQFTSSICISLVFPTHAKDVNESITAAPKCQAGDTEQLILLHMMFQPVDNK